jgi:hypothetical protein
MSNRPIPSVAGVSARIALCTYTADIHLTTLTLGTDNIHFDVFLSPRFIEGAQKYIRDLVAQAANLSQFYGMGAKAQRAPETSAFRKLLTELCQASLTRAQYERNIEVDVLFRLSLLKFFTQEIAAQFANALLECKEWIRARGEYFERSEQAYVMKARLSELQAGRRNVFRLVGQQLCQILVELDESLLAKSRRALFHEDLSGPYAMLKNRLVFVESGRDDLVHLEHYVLLGSFGRDPDRREAAEARLLRFMEECVFEHPPDKALHAAQEEHRKLTGEALRLRAQLGRLDKERDTLANKLEQGGAFLSRLADGRSPERLRAALAEVEQERAVVEQELTALGPRLEDAGRKVDFFTEAYNARLDGYLNEPENARRMLDSAWSDEDGAAHGEARARLLDEWVNRLKEDGLLVHVLASYELRALHRDYCPPIHLQQLKRALVNRAELSQVEEIAQQFPARGLSLKRLEERAKALRRFPPDQVRAAALRFAEDLMRLRRDQRDYLRLAALMDRIQFVRTERARELSRLNNSLYEYLLPEEARPKEDRVLSHTVIKADVRSSSKITQDLLARGLNPAAHFSLNLHQPVKGILDRYGAVKVFIEGDAIILAIYETESSRAHQRAVAKACVLARKILELTQAYNERAAASDLPRLELGVGIAFQNSPPTFWSDTESRIMISRALNLSDRLSSCSRVARRLLAKNPTPFNLFIFQTSMEGADEEEAEEFLIRYNLNGVEINEEGFQKLQEEMALKLAELDYVMPWGEERITVYSGEVLIGDAFEPIVVRKGTVHMLLPDGTIGGPGAHTYYEVCANPRVMPLFAERQAGVREPR